MFDWGGGTLDVTMLQSFDGVFIEQASKGIQRLGGIDIDEAFLAAMLPTSRAQPIGRDEASAFGLNLELAKISLSTAQSRLQLPLPRGGFIDVTRGQFEEAIRPLIQRHPEPVETCLRDSPGRIDHLVMVGGSSKIPGSQRFISEILGTDVADGVDPMTAIAEGAAIAAGILKGMITDLDFFVGTEHALGTVVHNPDTRRGGRVLRPDPTEHTSTRPAPPILHAGRGLPGVGPPAGDRG